MRMLNLAREPSGRFIPVRRRRLREIAFGGRRVWLDPGTLAAFEPDAKDAASGIRPEGPGLAPVFTRPDLDARPTALCLSVTHRCNLDCTYCFVRAHGAKPRSMSPDIGLRALGLIGGAKRRVGFFGGEPALEWDLCMSLADEARRRARDDGASVAFSMTTNGTLITRERAERLAAEGFSVIFSLDGPESLHNTTRPGSFVSAMAGLDALAAAGLGGRVTLRATFPLERPALVERLEFLNALADRGLARSVSVEPAWPAPGSPAPLDHLESEYLAAARWAEGRLAEGRAVRFHHLTKPLERILKMRPAGTECGAAYGYIEADPEGRLHACHKGVGGPVGDVWLGVNDEARARWRENRLGARRACRNCWARHACGGGCRAEFVEHSGSAGRIWAVHCAVKRTQIRAALYVAAGPAASAVLPADGRGRGADLLLGERGRS